MKKVLLSFLTVLVIFSVVCVVPASAENNVTDIKINVVISNNGDAVVTQTWSGSFDDGTECYLPIGNLPEGMDIKDFKAWNEAGKFQFVDDWDADASREEKKNKCGVVETDNGYELCFGIGDYGMNTYSFSYTVEKLVENYSDEDGFNFQFVNTEMNIYPTNVDVIIQPEDKSIKFNDDNCDIWAFGFDGQIKFKKNKIHAYTTSPLDSGDRYVNILTGFKKNLLSPTRAGEKESFDALYETAKEGSSYGSRESDGDMWLVILVLSLIMLAVIGVIIYTVYRKMQINKFVKKADYFRDVPCGNDLDMAYCLAKDFGQNRTEGSIIGACLLQLINSGSLEPVIETKTGFMGREKKSTNLKLVGQPTEHDSPASSLYNILFKAAGDDGILQEKELEKYSSKHSEALRTFIENCKGNGEGRLAQQGEYSKNINKISDYAKTNLAELVGLKKYLLDYSLIKERGIEENEIWEDFLVYATLLDISDKVMEQFKKVYPEKLPEFETYQQNLYLVYAYHNATYNAMRRAEEARAAGSGGAASFGGGGGFSGGGVGGGTR